MSRCVENVKSSFDTLVHIFDGWSSCNKATSGRFGSRGHMFFQMKKSCFEGSEAQHIYTNKPLSLCVDHDASVGVCDSAFAVQLLSSGISLR